MDITKAGSKINLSMVRGDYESIGVTLKGYTPVAGDFVELTVRQTPLSDALIYKKVSDFLDGRAVFEILPGDTEVLSFGKYVYDIQLTYGGRPKTIVPLSSFTLQEEATYGNNG